jgi:Lrp/AsnC family transcriptional regulator for asnA, asnC and gidA
VDDTDRSIIDALEHNARATFTEIARTLGLSESTVRKRVDALESSGVIKGYSVVLDPVMLGKRAVTYLGLDAEPEMFLDIVRALSEMDEVRWLATATGDHMIMAEIWADDDESLSRFLEERVKTIPGVMRICPTIVQERVR